MDNKSKQQRSLNMKMIKGRDTAPEILLRKAIWRKGYRYLKNYKKFPGKPDIAFPGKKKVIFVNGCFWHKHDCKFFSYPNTSSEFWTVKINRNAERDKQNYYELSKLGWSYFVVWTCELKKKNFDDTLEKVISYLNS